MLTARLSINLPSPEHSVEINWHNPCGCQFWFKRDDLIHPVISGNKWRKLSSQLQRLTGPQHIVSFGGGFSNHLHALGYVCQQLGWRFTAIIRGDYRQRLTPCLTDLYKWGAELEFVSKIDYQRRHDPAYLQRLQQRWPGCHLIAEGGSEADGLAGTAALLGELQQDYDYILLPVAIGGTLAGLASSSFRGQLVGIGVLGDAQYLASLVNGLAPGTPANWQVLDGFTHGGYAKRSDELMQFIAASGMSPDVPMEPVYSAKLLYAARQLCETGWFAANSRILLLHTGGLQAMRPHKSE